MKKLFPALLLSICFFLPAWTFSNPDFDRYAALQDSLMINAYNKRDAKTQEKLMEDVTSNYKKLSGAERANYKTYYSYSLYNVCCTYSLIKNNDKAIEYLAKAIKAGLDDYKIIEKDTDIANIKKDARFNAVIKPLKDLYLCSYNMEDAYMNSSVDSAVIKAQQTVLLAIKYRKALPEEDEVLYLRQLGTVLWISGNFPEAKETLLKALKKAETLDNPYQTAQIYTGLASVARNSGDYRQALNYFEKANSTLKDVPENIITVNILADEGKAYEQLNILDSAFSLLQECHAMAYRISKGKNLFGGVMHAESGIIYSKMGKKEMAEGYFRQGIQLDKEINDFRLLSRNYIEFAEHFDRFHQADSAIYYATTSLSIINQHKLLVYKLAACSLLAKLYTQEHKIDSAFKYQSLMIETQNNIFSNEKLTRLQGLEFNEQLRQQEMDAEKIKKEEERKNNIQFILIAIGLFTFIILFLLLSRSFITNTKLIEFFGVLALLMVFEFLNLLLHPFLENITHHTPALMLLALVIIAAMLIPLHHRVEKWAIEKLVEKNKQIRLARAKKTLEELKEEKEL